MAQPLVTIVMPSHKNPMLAEAIECVLAQTETNWQLLIYDAGHWTIEPDSPMHALYARYAGMDKRIEWILTFDPLDFRDHYCPVSYRYNQAVRDGRLKGTYSCVMPDDDLIAPTYIELLTKELETGLDAVYCSQSWVNYRNGITSPAGGLSASNTKRADCIGQIDLLQVMWRTSVLERMEQPYFTEDPTDAVCRIQDGLFFNRLCEVTDGIHPVHETLCTHRFHSSATYSPI